MARFGGLGRMRRARHLNAEVNIINLVDVILVLLIIFMITAPIMSGGVKVELPKSVVGPIETEDVLNIGITSKGMISIGNSSKLMTFDAFRASVGVVIANTHPKSASISGDASVPYGVVTRVMGVLNQHKLQLGLVAEPMKP